MIQIMKDDFQNNRISQKLPVARGNKCKVHRKDSSRKGHSSKKALWSKREVT